MRLFPTQEIKESVRDWLRNRSIMDLPGLIVAIGFLNMLIVFGIAITSCMYLLHDNHDDFIWFFGAIGIILLGIFIAFGIFLHAVFLGIEASKELSVEGG